MGLKNSAAKSLVYSVPRIFQPYSSSASTRLTYLYPEVTFVVDDTTIRASSKMDFDKDKLNKEIAHALYREKVYQETLPARLSLVQSLTRR